MPNCSAGVLVAIVCCAYSNANIRFQSFFMSTTVHLFRAAASKAVGAPKIEVIPETKDAGTVAKGQVIETTFLIKNSGASDLIISDARPGCGCTVASFDKVIKPGAEGKVQTSVDTKSFSGPISKSVLLVSNDPERGQINLFIKATVKPYVDILPQPYVPGLAERENPVEPTGVFVQAHAAILPEPVAVRCGAATPWHQTCSR